ncbi:uncharacterized protein N0V89_000109 [Didymosphaeria variabile]|uniref:Stress-response A/B barrel domain-containing protein n=1 Tax=Didymosphaeria variabile TaxID=1932322 RepID=A0A9W9CFD6_9PLEO|nr:uncharacterized protein N0V89_000109 [Didymosphaeria variabile]KAJ4359554.1 hypothetical protein N0V89_000109 [Didymosphaeria variabile]
MSPIVRLTLFKIPDPAVVQQAVQKYSTLYQEALKDGKPYIQISAGHVTHSDPHSRGYTFVARTVFLSKEDMDYYDEKDEKHGEIKSLLKGKVEEGPPVVVCMDG